MHRLLLSIVGLFWIQYATANNNFTQTVIDSIPPAISMTATDSIDTAEKPRFPGCENLTDVDEREQCSLNRLLQFVYNNISYPAIARENGIEGIVVASFVVERDGTVSNATILREIGGGCGKEVLRLISTMNEQDIRWIPGIVDGEAVRIQFNLPVKFQLQSRRKTRRRKRGG